MSSTTARSISTETSSRGLIDVSSLILLAILLAAGFILNMTAGNALAMTGIALSRATLAQSIVCGLISAAVIQFTTSIPGLNFLTEAAGALTMAVLVKSSIGGAKVNPLIATFVTTLVSGALFAVAGTLMAGFGLEAALPKVPLVLGTAIFNAVVVQALFFPLAKAIKK